MHMVAGSVTKDRSGFHFFLFFLLEQSVERGKIRMIMAA